MEEKIDELIGQLSTINDDNKDLKIEILIALIRELLNANRPLIIAGYRFTMLSGLSGEITTELTKCLVHDKNLFQISLKATTAAIQVVNKRNKTE